MVRELLRRIHASSPLTATIAALAAGCLLTTSLDGLEGPPLPPAGAGGGGAGAGETEGGTNDGSTPDGSGSGGAAGGSDGGGADAPLDSGAADGGSKGPFTVAPTGALVLGIAEHGGEIFWVQGGTGAGIVRASKLGGGASYVHRTADAFDVVVDDNDVYWSTGNGNEVYKKPRDSDAAVSELVFSGAGQTLYLAAGSGPRLYVTGRDTVAVGVRADAGTSDVLYPFQIGAAGIAVNGEDLFWSVETSIVRGRDDGTMMHVIYRGAPGEVRGIATDEQDVYWKAKDGTIQAISYTDPGALLPRDVCHVDPDTNTDGGQRAAADVAVDGQWVYFAEPAKRTISKCLKR